MTTPGYPAKLHIIPLIWYGSLYEVTLNDLTMKAGLSMGRASYLFCLLLYWNSAFLVKRAGFQFFLFFGYIKVED